MGRNQSVQCNERCGVFRSPSVLVFAFSFFLSLPYTLVLEMDNQDQRTTHTHTQGQEGHRGVLACNKKICGTIGGHKPLVSEHQTQSNEKHASDYEPYTQGPNSLDTGNNEKVNVVHRSGDDWFVDARTNFSDGAPSPGSKEPLRDSLDSAIDVEITNIKYHKLSGSSDFNAADVNQLIEKSTHDSQMQDPNISHSERIKEGNMLEFQGQLPGSHVDPPSSSVKGLENFVLIDDYFGVSRDSNLSKAKGAPDMLLENKIYACENVTPCSLTSVAKNTNLEENDEIKSDFEMIDIEAISDKAVGDTSEGTLKVAVSDLVNADGKVSSRYFDLKEKNNVEFISVTTLEEFSLEINSTLSTNTSTNDVQVESAHTMQFTTSGDVKMLQEMEEGYFNMFTSSMCDDRADVTHPQDECVDFKDPKRVLQKNSLRLPLSEPGKPKHDDLRDSDDEDNYFVINQSELNKKREVLPPDGRVLDSSTMKQEGRELVAEEGIEVPSAKFMIESDRTSDEIAASMNCKKIEMSENYMMCFDEESRSDDSHKKSQRTSLPQGSFFAASEDNPIDTSFRGSTTEMDKISHHEKYIEEINCKCVDDKCRATNVENDIESSLNTQLSNLHLEVKPSSGVYKSDDVVEVDKFETCDITDAQYMERPTVQDSSLAKSAGSNFEYPIRSEAVINMSARTPRRIECASRSPPSGAPEDNEINSSCRANIECNRFISTSANSHQTQNAEAELLVKATGDLGLPSFLKDPKAESERQQCEKPEMGMNQQHPSFTSSQSSWFPTQTQDTHEFRGTKWNEEIIEEINYKTSKQHTPPQSPLSEAAHSNKLGSPKLEENSMIAAEAGKGSNSPADIKRQNKKVKRKPYWMPFMCCSSVDSP